MKYLYNFSVDEFNEFVEESKIDNWWIYNNTIEERHKAISNKDYYKTLRKMANKNKITFNEAEIVSWIDGLSMMYSSLEYAIDNDKGVTFDNLRIIGELHIPFSKCRADGVLVKDNKILILEFSYLNHQNRKEKYEEKLNQVMYYKELLSNALPKHIEIATYSFPIETETDKNGNFLLEYSEIAKDKMYKNHDSCYYLAQFIVEFFKTTNKTAIDELNALSDDCLIKPKKKKLA